MDSKWTRRLGLVALAGGILYGSVGCAQERDPINRVQANALSKHFFVGASLSDTKDDPEFYMRNTVVDVPYGAAQDGLFTASYAQPLSRIKWQITENALVARQTYEHIKNSDHKGSRRTNDGQVVAMFAIQSHFDIRRAYNTTTGEESNVVEENTTDRPWYEREYFRVDWSKNQVTDGYEVDTLSQIGVFGGIQWDPMAFYVADPSDANAPKFVENEGYFDVTTKAFATPKVVEIPEIPGEKFPFCFFPGEYGGSYPIGNCNPTEVTLRLSFRKVTDNDYEPSDWNGKRMEAFGWFTVDRYGYERNYGVLDEQWHRFAAKYNIWTASHISDGNPDPEQRRYAQCATDFWRDNDGNIQKFKVQTQSDGSVGYFRDSKGLPILDSSDKGQPLAQSPVGKDVHRDDNHNGTEDECEYPDKDGIAQPYPGMEGARCDEFTNRCTIPHRNRTIKTLPWYYGPEAPADLFASTANALGQWNLAVKRAAQIGKLVDARRTGAEKQDYIIDEDALAQDNGVTVPEVFVLCHNPTTDGDHPACRNVAVDQQKNCMVKVLHTNDGNEACNWGGPMDKKGKRNQVTARLGDIRYNIVNIINSPQTPSPWGIMVDADDPLTGEKVSTSVNEWGHVLDIASQGTEDLLRWINGEITDAQVMSGEYLRDWVNASALGTKQHAPAVLPAGEVQSRLRSLDKSLSKMNGLSKLDAALPREIAQKKAAQNLAASLGPSLDTDFESFRQSIIGTQWETQLTTPEWVQAAGFDPKTPVAGNSTLLAQASPMRGQNPQLRSKLNMLRGKTLAERGSCIVEQPEPDSLVGMARQAQRLYPLPDKADPDYPALKARRDQALHQWIREQFHISVIAHEMGHSVGLRHNFTGSYDALNYHPQYWQLRTQNGKEHYCTQDKKFNPQTSGLDATTPHTNGADCVGPRWVDPLTDAETNGLIWKWGSTTVMDYPGDQTQDMNNIGLYDKAAMRFGYADVVDVDNDAVLAGGTNDGKRDTKAGAYLFALDGFGGIVGDSLGGNHYSTFNDKYKVIRNCQPPTDPNDPLTAKCDSFDIDYVSLRDMRPVGKYGEAALDHLPQTRANFAVDSRNRVRHPYMFGSDEYADFGNVPVFRFDAGADSYEQFQFIISTYENRYIFDNFRRDRATFNSKAVINRAVDRYFDKVQGMTKSLALLMALQSNADAALADPGQLMPLALGASDSLAMFARILTRPEPGPYQVNFPEDSTKSLAFAQAISENYITLPPASFTISPGSGEGRYLHNDYDYTQGYYWSEYQKWAGSSYEKHLAVHFLTEGYNHFVSNAKEDYIDGRYKNLNYASIYPNQVRRLFSQYLQGDPMTIGPYVTSSNGGLTKDRVARVRYLPWEKYDVLDSTTLSLDYAKDTLAVVDPLIGWEQQYRMLINVFWFGPTTLTMDAIDQVRIYTPGGADAITIDPAEQIRFKDPTTGIVYYARTYGKEMVNAKVGSVQKSMGARMLEYAQKLAAATYQVDAVNPQGEATYHKNPDGSPTCLDEALCAAGAGKLKAYVATLDVTRQLTRQYGYGPLRHGN